MRRLPRKPGQVWRALGLAGVLICSVEAAFDLPGFQERQRTQSDDPALMVAILLLLQWLMPLTAGSVLMGAVPGPARPQTAVDGRRRVLVWLMRAGAAWGLAFGVCLKILEMRAPNGNPSVAWFGPLEWMVGLVPLLYAVLVWTSAAVILRPAVVHAAWFRIVLEGCGIAAAAPLVVAISDSLPWTTEPGTLARIGIELAWTAVPSLGLMVVIGRTLHITRRAADPVPRT